MPNTSSFALTQPTRTRISNGFGNTKRGRWDILDSSDSYVQLAIQGPQAQAVLQQLTEVDLSSLQYYWFTHGQVHGAQALISRTGYTGGGRL